jgi:hypothetical protein
MQASLYSLLICFIKNSCFVIAVKLHGQYYIRPKIRLLILELILLGVSCPYCFVFLHNQIFDTNHLSRLFVLYCYKMGVILLYQLLCMTNCKIYTSILQILIVRWVQRYIVLHSLDYLKFISSYVMSGSY